MVRCELWVVCDGLTQPYLISKRTTAGLHTSIDNRHASLFLIKNFKMLFLRYLYRAHSHTRTQLHIDKHNVFREYYSLFPFCEEFSGAAGTETVLLRRLTFPNDKKITKNTWSVHCSVQCAASKKEKKKNKKTNMKPSSNTVNKCHCSCYSIERRFLQRTEQLLNCFFVTNIHSYTYRNVCTYHMRAGEKQKRDYSVENGKIPWLKFQVFVKCFVHRFAHFSCEAIFRKL